MEEKKKNEAKPAKNVGAKAAIYTAALIAVAIGLIAVSSLLLPGIGRAIRPPAHEPAELPPGDLAPFEENFLLPVFISLLNVCLAVYILFVYVKDYLSIRSNFTLGMVAFLFSFLLYALSSSPLLHMLLGPYGIAGKLSFVPMLFSAICLMIFAKLSSE
jgi:hypothetical protein